MPWRTSYATLLLAPLAAAASDLLWRSPEILLPGRLRDLSARNAADAQRISLDELPPDASARLAAEVGFDGFKRAIDVALVVLGAPFAALLGALVAVAIWRDSPGPVLFRQRRVGRGGRSFVMLKFRTMAVDAEATGPRFAGAHDPRITGVGRFLRKTRLDELPQLWNVLKGDMSLIGPRPEQVPFVERFAEEIPHYGVRHVVRPGLTGWAQVNQGYAASTEETRVKLEYDLYYVMRRSLALDLLVLARTVPTVLHGAGAR